MVAHAAQPCPGSSCCCPLVPWLQLLLLLPLLMRAHNSFHYCFDILFIECEQACVRPTPALALHLSLFPSFSPPFVVVVVAGAGQIFFAQIVNGLVSFCSNKWNQCPCHTPSPDLAHPSVTPPSIAELYVIQLLVAAACVVWQNKRLRQRTRVKSRWTKATTTSQRRLDCSRCWPKQTNEILMIMYCVTTCPANLHKHKKRQGIKVS